MKYFQVILYFNIYFIIKEFILIMNLFFMEKL